MMEISHQALDPDWTVVRLKGRLDAYTCPAVKADLNDLIAGGQLKIVIDLQEVPFMDSSGLSSLVSGLRLVREKGGNLALSGVQEKVQVVLRLTMLDRVFPIHATPQAAQQNLP
ncbi:MAG: STAS domain-containing protein [Anaerolineales bacterium]|nr:STAS domain-containing protein [Anaerolineales bacterium]